jgi:hypothetical protein
VIFPKQTTCEARQAVSGPHRSKRFERTHHHPDSSEDFRSSGVAVRQAGSHRCSRLEGHMLALGEMRGTNQNTSASDFFADASAVNVETADLMQGNGTHQGYYTMRNGGDAVTAKWHGAVTTVLGPNQQPHTSFKGTWEYIQGTGRYRGIEGSGLYEGEFLTQDRYLVRWQGEWRQ